MLYWRNFSSVPYLIARVSLFIKKLQKIFIIILRITWKEIYSYGKKFYFILFSYINMYSTCF
jgi:hypothetical protein